MTLVAHSELVLREEQAAAVWIDAIDRAERTGADEDWLRAHGAYREYQSAKRARWDLTGRDA